MAKIRSIKPEFWDDTSVAELPIHARLLFIGMWNFADDNGVILSSPKYLKAKIFPYDNFPEGDLHIWAESLVTNRMLVPFSYQNKNFYIIRKFRNHQIIDKRFMKETVPAEYLPLNHNDNTMGTHSDHMVDTTLEVEVVLEVEGKGGGGGRLAKKFSPPTLTQVIEYFEENKFSKELAEKAFAYYDSAQWKDSQGNQVKNWKQKMISVWFKKQTHKNGSSSIADAIRNF